MAGIIELGKEYDQLAKSMNGLCIGFTDISKRIVDKHSKNDTDYSEFKEELYSSAYILRRGVMDRMIKYKWPEDGLIMVTYLSEDLISLRSAFNTTIDSLQKLASICKETAVVNSILAKKNAYYEYEKVIPKEVLNQIEF